MKSAAILDVDGTRPREGGFSEAELREAGAVAVYHSVEELRDSLDEWLTS